MMSSVAPLEPTPAAPDPADLHREHYRALVRLASILVDDVGTCEEIVQEAFVNVLRRRATVEPDRFPAYLRSAVLNGARSSLRRRVVRQRHLQAVADPEPSAEARALAGRDADRVLAELRALPGRQREVLSLRFYLDLSEAEIAATLGISAGSVKTHAHRGLARLAERLGAAR